MRFLDLPRARSNGPGVFFEEVKNCLPGNLYIRRTGRLFGGPPLAGPILTTIQDVIYNANGTPYNGFAVITWTPFIAGDTSQIATQSVTVNIIAGNLLVQLVPTTNATPAGYYSVTFTSTGNDQFTETGQFRRAPTALRVQAVLISQATGGTGATAADHRRYTHTGVGCDRVVGGSRARVPWKDPIWGRDVAMIDSTGALEAVSGNVSDCVHVDGSSGPCGTSCSVAAGPNFTDAEVPAGALNGANTSFTLSAVPIPTTSIALYRNGVLQKAGQDYNLSGNTVQFLAASTPQTGDTLVASYRVTPPGAPQGPPAPQISVLRHGQRHILHDAYHTGHLYHRRRYHPAGRPRQDRLRLFA